MNSYAGTSGNDCGEFEMGVDYPVTDEGGGMEAATNEAEEPACKRAKMQLTVPEDMLVLRRKILEHKLLRLKNVREKCTEQLMELYYLQAGGNMMEFNTWKKRPPAPQLTAFLEARKPAGPEAATPVPAHDEVVEKARQEAYVARRVAELARAGLWAERRLPRVMEPPRPKTHWDYLLEEMAWLAQDFAHERKWKKQAAKKCAKAVQKYFQDKAMAAQKAEKAQELQLRKIAAFAAKEIRTFWANVEKVVEWKRTRRVEKARKEALDEQLSYMVDRSEKYSRQLAAKLHRAPDSDSEFTPRGDSDDDEETIDEQERAERPQRDELDTLKRESQKDIADLLPPGYTPGAPSPPPSDYSGHEDDADDETTIEAQERAEMEVDHDDEIRHLQNEAEMDVEELRRRYCGDAPTASSATPSDILDDDGNDETDIESGSDSDSESESSAESDSSRLESLVEGTEKKEEASGEAGVQAAASIAATLQPTGTTLSETSVGTPVPMLLKHTLREYQHVGLHWLATMHSRKLNGILADEMGLGKTIQTIALLAHLAVDHGDWGPHLVVAPTSVVLNWECEFKKWCPAFKILTYYGSIKERKLKRVGWTKANYFHICITSYKLVVQDHQSFRRKRWKYLILDEAQNIKNFKSQRWQLLLNFATERRLLLTGTPLQNSLLELWSLMHFLMPGVFASQSEFKEWFTPVAGIAAGAARHDDALVRRLHEVLRPFLLRRLKADVERQMPRKYEHVLMCRLAKRQRALYDDFMSRAQTKSSLASGNLLSVINVLMQLRKVCNHPDLFEPRPVSSPLQLEALNIRVPALVMHTGIFSRQALAARLGGALCDLEASGAAAFPAHRARHLAPPRRAAPPTVAPRPPATRLRLHLRLVPRTPPPTAPLPRPLAATGAPDPPPAAPPPPLLSGPVARLEAWRAAAARRVALENERRCWRLPLYGSDLRACVSAPAPPVPPPLAPATLQDLLTSLHDLIDQFTICWETARAPSPELVVAAPLTPAARRWRERVTAVTQVFEDAAKPLLRLIHMPALRQSVAFPHPRLLQYDCGKLQTLDELLRRLKRGSHRVLIFTQMTRVLDVLEAFLSMHGHTYLRLDGATKVEARQALVERFNADARVFCMILSTRSGGVGLNLTGADCVVFYDSDWNPTMDAQAQDRCHRIGQTRDVHVYRLVTAATVEENILRKAEQKRALGHLAIEDGHFTTSYLRTGSIEELFGASVAKEVSETRNEGEPRDEDAAVERALAAAEDEADAAACVAARQEAQQDLAEFDETQPLEDAPNVPQDKDEMQLAQLMKQLTPVEKYAMRVVESSEDAHVAEQAALEEMKRQLHEWEQARRALRESTPPSPLTYPRGQMEEWVSVEGSVAPTWGPPTPPAGAGDVYVGRWSSILYRGGAAAEHRLPAVTRAPAPSRRRPVRAPHAPLSLFERGGRVRGRTRPPRDPAPPSGDWTAAEDTALRRALRLQRLPPDPAPATTPNWEWCADLVNDVSRQYRGPRAVRDRHDSLLADPDRARRKHKKVPRRSDAATELRPPLSRMDALREAAERRRRAPRRRYDEPPADAARHSALLTEQGIVYDNPPSPMEVAARRADRIQKEKLKSGGGGGGGGAVATPPTSGVAAGTPGPQRVVVAATKPDTTAPRRPTPSAPQLHLYRQQAFRQHLKILHHTTQGGPAVASTSEATVSTAVRGAAPRRPTAPPGPRAAPPVLLAHLSPAPPPDNTHH